MKVDKEKQGLARIMLMRGKKPLEISNLLGTHRNTVEKYRQELVREGWMQKIGRSTFVAVEGILLEWDEFMDSLDRPIRRKGKC